MEIEEIEKMGKHKKSSKPEVKLPVCYELEMHRIIEVEAYLLAEQDGFRQSPDYYWHAAEMEMHQYY